ncbi:MAG: hypothetical protein ACT4PO_13115 [Actinomycetota bacterium]
METAIASQNDRLTRETIRVLLRCGGEESPTLLYNLSRGGINRRLFSPLVSNLKKDREGILG